MVTGVQTCALPISRAFRLVLTEGRNRQIRRMCEALEVGVKRLVRVRVMNIELGTLRQGRWRKLREDELRELEAQLAASEARREPKASEGGRPRPPAAGSR